ncbi:MAG: cell division protein [Erythrobacter sp.]|jgi:cell division transport system permease protein|uniref:cell division protein FtsX n=1 Tax=Erythrobacter sp. TaxID=1042 RepID=UPI002B479440|nr:FtsX-like permease family protein [Erythrobacter sp.]WRH69896.1 MAG: cell division protein [Erythrobacter sp.]
MSVPPLPEVPEEATAPAAPAGKRRQPRAARLLPQPRMGGLMPWVIAILIALVVIAAAGGLGLRNLAESARADLASAVTVQVIEPNPDLRAARGAETVKLLQGMTLVRSVRLVPPEELAALLEPWLGPAATSGDVPIPVLVDVELVRRASPADLETLTAALERKVPGARVDAQSDWLRPVYSALSALQWLALGLIGLVALATAAAVWLASRNALASHRETVEIIHLLGGTDRQITRIFLGTVLREAAFGALVGTAAGLGAVLLLGQQFAALDSGMTSGGGFASVDWLVIAAVPLAGVLLALMTARMTIALALRDML